MKQTRIHNYLEPRLTYNSGKEFSLSTWRKKVLQRDRMRCQNCFNTVHDPFRNMTNRLEAHHIIPRNHGGRNTIENGISLCSFCHDIADKISFSGEDYREFVKKAEAGSRIDTARSLIRKRYIRSLFRNVE